MDLLLCLTSMLLQVKFLPVESVFQQVQIKCDVQNNITTAACLDPDFCTWKIDLMTCDTLQMHCIRNDVLQTVSFCNSSKECGFDGFPDQVLGHLECEITKENEMDEIDCSVDVKCEHEMHICATPKSCRWAPNQLFKDVGSSRCVLKHDVSRCIRANPKWNLTEHLNCTMMYEGTVDNIHGDTSVNLCSKTEALGGGLITSIAFNVIFIIVVVILAVLLISTCKKLNTYRRANEEHSQTGNQGNHEPIPLEDQESNGNASPQTPSQEAATASQDGAAQDAASQDEAPDV
ncbi:uncharacterized protein LOC118804441 [Colossoma macropomum]|uniref:uncharacterized protein LOC118804441 n=1 Tax=Colossoma macropomum TaxID=42526 RepID=UPI001863BF69|nr:uncharacterized protein LOC118804441 [Colossoma macropomum]